MAFWDHIRYHVAPRDGSILHFLIVSSAWPCVLMLHCEGRRNAGGSLIKPSVCGYVDRTAPGAMNRRHMLESSSDQNSTHPSLTITTLADGRLARPTDPISVSPPRTVPLSPAVPSARHPDPFLRMGHLLAPLAICAALVTLVHAGVEFRKPIAGAILDAGKAMTVEWTDGGVGPALTDLGPYTLHLCQGGVGDTMVS
jgi:hypothetical protein